MINDPIFEKVRKNREKLLIETSEKLTISCHSERSEESILLIFKEPGFFATLRMTIFQMFLIIIIFNLIILEKKINN